MGKQFTSEYQPKHTPHKGPYLTTILTKLLATKLTSSDKEVEAALKASGVKKTKAAGIALRYIFNGLEGDTKAIEGIIDRTDGKVLQKTEFSGTVNMLPVTKIRGKKAEYDIG